MEKHGPPGWTWTAGFGRRRWKWFVIPVAVIAITLAALDRLLDEPLRHQMEHRLNDRLRGYAVTLRGLDFHVIGGSGSSTRVWSAAWRSSSRNTPREEVATKTSVSGRIENPQTNTAETIVRLIQNAFFQAILRGFDRELDRIRRA